jgi:hypothetical protein
MASKKRVKELVKKDLGLKKAALNSIEGVNVLDKKTLQDVALKVLEGYRERVEVLREQGYTKAEAVASFQKDPKLLVQRVQNATSYEISQRIKETYEGEFFIWLPSTAVVPDEEHAKKYGKRFRIGVGEMPGDRYGCQCGMEILVDAKRLKLE